MADIRKRTGSKGTTYQVRYPTTGAKSGYGYATFNTLKEARAFREDGSARKRGAPDRSVRTVVQAVDLWLDICEKEGTDGNEPVTDYTLKTYKYLAQFMKSYSWPKPLAELDPATRYPVDTKLSVASVKPRATTTNEAKRPRLVAAMYLHAAFTRLEHASLSGAPAAKCGP